MKWALSDACGGSLHGKKVLELGCNLGLLSVFAAREGAVCDAYDSHKDIIEAAELVSKAYNVSEQCAFRQINFNDDKQLDTIGDEYDVCTCLSLLKWVKKKEQFIEVLSKQKTLIYEGHDDDDSELRLLRHLGFDYVYKVAVSDLKRSIFLASKIQLKISKPISWDEIENIYGLAGIPFHTPNTKLGDGRVYERTYINSKVMKFRLSLDKNPAKFASPEDEAVFLEYLRKVPNICRLIEHIKHNDHTINVLEYIPNIGTLDKVVIPPEFKSKVETQKHTLIKSINDAGVLHNDIGDMNFLVNSDYKLFLIDFDQAQWAEGKNDYEHGFWKKAQRVNPKPVNELKMNNLEQAWNIAAKSNASSPGREIAYYSLDINGRHYPGERDWDKRWNYLGGALRKACDGNMAGKKILELGSNLGLLSIWAAREGAICKGYEYAADIQKGSKLIAKALGVDDRCSWQQADFNKPDVTAQIEDGYDVCTCLSVMNWVKDKDNLINLLSRQNVVLYEGHDSDEVEMGRLRQAGFTNIEKVTESERKRGVFLAKKDESPQPLTDNTKNELLEKAWDIAAKSNASFPGKYIAYYSLNIDGKTYSGERKWEDRWSYIGKSLQQACGGSLQGKRVLELGSNLGLLSIWAAREGSTCIGYEYEADIQEGSKLIAQALGVTDRCSWQQADFNKPAVTDQIPNGYDVCTCLSVMNWVKDKENLIRLLSRQNVVLYEGHDRDEIELSRLRQAGFTNIEKVTESERKRGVFLAKKEVI
ncbi:MAG: hypothetical protein K9L30_04095 [Desulfobacterales bacterium]|nr:hypothetical protein [Desulfobacterales bacterium]